jgi:hypothetical protein
MAKARRNRRFRSIIEASRVAVAPRTAARARRARGARPGAAAWQQLDFPLQHQQHVYWCWAAVATSVAQYYRPHAAWTQCTVANAELGRRDCCGSGGHRKCNVIGHLVQSLRVVGHFRRHRRARSSFGQTEREVFAGQPLGARVEWDGGGGHYVTIVGYLPKRRMLAIDDPYYGRSHVHYRRFCRGYLDHGTWTDSYFTRR